MSSHHDESATPSLYWATIGYADAWWITDGANVRRIARLNGQTATNLMECIAREYKVFRGLEAGKRNCLRDILNSEAEKWPDQAEGGKCLLVTRAERCVEIMECARKDGCFSNDSRQISAVTKFMWFLRPDGWTVFDNLASKGLGLPSGDTIKRMKKFYEGLSKRGFEDVTRRMQEVIDNTIIRSNSLSPYHGLHATRIIDRLLMDRSREELSARTRAEYLAIGPHDRRELDELAKKLEHEFKKDVANVIGSVPGGGRHGKSP